MTDKIVDNFQKHYESMTSEERKDYLKKMGFIFDSSEEKTN